MGNMVDFHTAPIDVVKVGFVGLGSRGLAALERYTRIEGVRIVAICDTYPNRVKDAGRYLDYSKGVSEYDGSEGWKRLCSNPAVDLVYICTDWQSHTEIACYAMKCGRHVAVEVPAATTLDECRRLVLTAEQTRRHCIMLENCIYDVFEAATFGMVRDGMFGEIYLAEGGYIHNLKYLNKWRADFNKLSKGDNYPTHGFGPICRLLGIHRTDTLHCLTSYKTHMPDGDHIVSIIKTRKGKTIILQHNIHAARPYSRLYQFTGEKGFAVKYPEYRISLLPDSDSWISDGELSELIDRYTPDYYEQVRKIMPSDAEPRRLMDYVMDSRLVYCLRNGLPLDMDVYDAAEWSSIIELSHLSIENASQTMMFPDFLPQDNP